ncbi:MAG: DUF6660 family protein [Mucilaginibacter sp.]
MFYICHEMRYMALLFSLYFTALAVLPCQDREDRIASAVNQVTIQKSHSCNEQKSQETCPPFCTCSCCSTASHLTKVLTTPIFTKPITREYRDYRTSAISEQPVKIWQPPQ